MKSYKIVLYKDAILDLKQALDYYQKINPEIAQKFYQVTNTTLEQLKRNPFYQIRYDEFRLKVIKGFPYIIHFIVEENNKTVKVFGIRNHHQDPETSYFKI